MDRAFFQKAYYLNIQYSSEDPGVLLIKGDSARILKAGKTHIIAFQPGDRNYREKKVLVPLTILARPVVIKPIAGQVFTYPALQLPIKYEIVSGSVVNDDKFSGQLERTKGDTVGIYRSLEAQSLV